MKNTTIIVGLSLSFLGAFAPSASATTAPTMNQPDNGFYEGPSPEWATLHATSPLGTAVHRQYHRDAVQALLQWLNLHRSEQGTMAYYNAHRVVVQDRNMLHRQFHTAPVVAMEPTPAPAPRPAPNDGGTVNEPDPTPIDRTYTSRPSRRSIVAAAEERNLNRVR